MRFHPPRSQTQYTQRLLFQHTLHISYPYRLRYRRDINRTSKFLFAYLNTIKDHIQR